MCAQSFALSTMEHSLSQIEDSIHAASIRSHLLLLLSLLQRIYLLRISRSWWVAYCPRHPPLRDGAQCYDVLAIISLLPKPYWTTLIFSIRGLLSNFFSHTHEGFTFSAQAITLSAFMCVSMLVNVTTYALNPFYCSLLLIDFVASTASGHDVRKALARKSKSPLPIPVRHLPLFTNEHANKRPALLY